MITREDYLNALELIDQYHQQLNLPDIPLDKTTICEWLNKHDVPTRIETILTNERYNEPKLEYIEDITEKQWIRRYLGSKKNWQIFKQFRGY